MDPFFRFRDSVQLSVSSRQFDLSSVFKLSACGIESEIFFSLLWSEHEMTSVVSTIKTARRNFITFCVFRESSGAAARYEDDREITISEWELQRLWRYSFRCPIINVRTFSFNSGKSSIDKFAVSMGLSQMA